MYFCGQQNMRNYIKCRSIRVLEVEDRGCKLCIQTLSKEMEVSWICIIKLNRVNQEIIDTLLYDTFILYLQVFIWILHLNPLSPLSLPYPYLINNYFFNYYCCTHVYAYILTPLCKTESIYLCYMYFCPSKNKEFFKDS